MDEETVSSVANEPGADEASFDAIYKEFERANQRREGEQIRATVVSVTDDAVYLDIGFKTEGSLPRVAAGEVSVGQGLTVSVKGRNEEGYYECSVVKVAAPKDWGSLKKAFEEGAVVSGTVTGVVKGGLTVDVGVRAFLPASRSGVRDAAEMEKLVGQEIRCKLTKVEEAEENVVVDRRGVLEAEAALGREARFGAVAEGEIVRGTVRSIMEYGAFVDLGGVDGLLHISDIAWSRVANVADVLTVGQEIEAKVLKVDAAAKRISLGMKQLAAHPWDGLGERLKIGDRVTGRVTRVADFGGFVEVLPGVEGMVHVSEMSWAKKVRKAIDALKPGETVEVVVLGIDTAERRMALGLKQALGDPWAEVAERFPVGSTVEGPVVSFMKFGAFVQVAEGIEGMVHISEIVGDRRLNHPQEVLRAGQVVKAKVLEFDREKRQMKLSMKQLIPTGLDEFLAEHQVGDVVTGRLVSVEGGSAVVELGEGIRVAGVAVGGAKEEAKAEGALDLSALTSMLSAHFKSGGTAKKADMAAAGQMRSFRIVGMDLGTKDVQLEWVE